MTLAEFLATLTQTTLLITVVEAGSSGAEVIRFYVGGTSALNATLTAREIADITVNTSTTITVKLAAA